MGVDIVGIDILGGDILGRHLELLPKAPAKVFAVSYKQSYNFRTKKL